MISFIFAWLLAMLTGQPAPTVPPAPAAVVVSAPAHHPRGEAPTKRVVPPAPVVTTPQAPTAPATVAEQLPAEVSGRQIDCPDGSVGVEQADGTVVGCQ